MKTIWQSSYCKYVNIGGSSTEYKVDGYGLRNITTYVFWQKTEQPGPSKMSQADILTSPFPSLLSLEIGTQGLS